MSLGDGNKGFKTKPYPHEAELVVIKDEQGLSGLSQKKSPNNRAQRKIGKDLYSVPSTVHNIIKQFKESGRNSVYKRQQH